MIKVRRFHRQSAVAAAVMVLSMQAMSAPTCYPDYGPVDPKLNKLFLYFPLADDATFPAYAPLVSPVRAFDVSALPNAPAGSTSQLRDNVYDVVATDYCEFSVDVQQTTTNPDAMFSPPPRRNIVGIGPDANGDVNGVLFGQAENVDIGDAIAIDHARVWGGSYGVFCGAPGGALDGAGNTLERWSYAIGGTAAHEAGHNYGASHGDGAIVRPGEDVLTNHIMPAGSLVPCTARVSQRRHFNDTVYGILANNVGLRLQSLTNWDYVNPNSASASALQLEVLSKSTVVGPASPWEGGWNPWDVPSVSGPLGTRVFKGDTYNRFLVTWSTPKAWQSKNQPGSTPGVVRGGEEFHVGTNLSGNNPDPTLIITNTTLLDASNTPLPLHPRTPSYNQGDILADGTFAFTLFNAEAIPLLLRNWHAWVLPRPLSIDALAGNGNGGVSFFAVDKLPFEPWRQVQLPAAAELPPGSPEQPSEMRFNLGNLFKQGHNVRIIHRPTIGRFAVATADAFGTRAEVNPDKVGTLVSDPFPGTSVFLEGEVVEPNATVWDPSQKQFVTHELVTHVFLQVAGQRVKPVAGELTGLLRGGKVTCSNLNSRRSVSVTPVVPAAGGAASWDCESSGLITHPGDRVQVTQVGLVTQAPAVQLFGLDISKVVCTNLNNRKSVSFVPESSNAPMSCQNAGLDIKAEQILQISQIGTVR